jgi:hypothetical protein
MALDQLRAFRQQLSGQILRAPLPHVSLGHRSGAREMLCTGGMWGLIIWLILWWTFEGYHIHAPGEKAFAVGASLMLMVWTYPFLDIIRFGLKLFKPRWHKWWNYSTSYQILACAALLYGLGFSYNLASHMDVADFKRWLAPATQTPSLKKVKPTKSSQKKPFETPQVPRQPLSPLQKLWMWGSWPLSTMVLFFAMAYLAQRYSPARPHQPKRKQPPQQLTTPLPFSLWLGLSSGALVHRWHPANLAALQHIGLSLQDAAQNILILGAIGSGKTTRAIHPLLLQLLDQNCGGLIFDIKGDFKQAVTTFAEQTQAAPIVIGVGQQPFNLLAGLPPEMAATFLKSALLLAGGSKAEGFWIDTATEMCRNALGVLSFIPQLYNLNGLYCYVFDPSFQKEIHGQLVNQENPLQEQRKCEAYQYYLQSIFGQFDEKVKSGVLASIAQILSPFQHPDLVDAFCTASSTPPIETLLNGTVYVIDMPLARWGIAGKVIYTLIKLRFFNTMQQRTLHPDWNQTQPVFFMCDEYQEIVSCNKDGLSDLNFWDKSRSSKTIGIISAQSISSFYAAIGERDMAHAFLQNFRQKLVFRVEDDWTIQYCNRLIGQVQTQQIVHSMSSGKTSGKQDSHNRSSSQSISYQQKDVIDGQLFRNMQQNQALALLSIQGHAADDILEMMPVFV